VIQDKKRVKFGLRNSGASKENNNTNKLLRGNPINNTSISHRSNITQDNNSGDTFVIHPNKGNANPLTDSHDQKKLSSPLTEHQGFLITRAPRDVSG
jgi:hypothetical protein